MGNTQRCYTFLDCHSLNKNCTAGNYRLPSHDVLHYSLLIPCEKFSNTLRFRLCREIKKSNKKHWIFLLISTSKFEGVLQYSLKRQKHMASNKFMKGKKGFSFLEIVKTSQRFFFSFLPGYTIFYFYAIIFFVLNELQTARNVILFWNILLFYFVEHKRLNENLIILIYFGSS